MFGTVAKWCFSISTVINTLSISSCLSVFWICSERLLAIFSHANKNIQLQAVKLLANISQAQNINGPYLLPEMWCITSTLLLIKTSTGIDCAVFEPAPKLVMPLMGSFIQWDAIGPCPIQERTWMVSRGGAGALHYQGIFSFVCTRDRQYTGFINVIGVTLCHNMAFPILLLQCLCIYCRPTHRSNVESI